MPREFISRKEPQKMPRERGDEERDAAFLLTVGSFLLTLELSYLQLTIRNFPVTQPPVFSQKYCRTNGRRTAVQMGGVLLGFPSSRLRSQEAYCHTNWRCTAVLSSRPVGVGVSETLLRQF